MRKLRIYIDTSVIGGYFDNEFEQETKELFQKFTNKEYVAVISDITERELLAAPDHVRRLLVNLKINFESLTTTQEVNTLADEYLNEKVVGATSKNDCLHIAIATINKVDILASWNFKHIVNIKRIRGYNSINIKNAYSAIEIRSPKDLIDHEN
jgi:predicted nucleic acid-binding protein